MSGSTYESKVYRKQGGEELVVASGGKITIESGGTIDASSGTTTLGAGSVALTKISVTGIKCLAAAGKNGAGAITLTGAAVGDRLVAVFGAPTAGGTLEVKVPGTDFEAAMTVENQIQQVSVSNLSANTYAFVLIPAAA